MTQETPEEWAARTVANRLAYIASPEEYTATIVQMIGEACASARTEAVDAYMMGDDFKRLLARAGESAFDSAYTDWKLALGKVIPGDYLDYCDAKHAVAKVKELLIAARLEALEEAAKIAETVKTGSVYFVDGLPNAGSVIGGEIIAAAIRERMKAIPMTGTETITSAGAIPQSTKIDRSWKPGSGIPWFELPDDGNKP